MCVRWHCGAGVSTVASQPDGLWVQGVSLWSLHIFPVCVCVCGLYLSTLASSQKHAFGGWVNW